MALKKCKECGHQISTKAEKCPSCGMVLKKKRSSIGCGGLILIVIIVLSFASMCTSKTTTRPAPSTPTTPREVVENNPWDSSVRQVEKYLEATLKDPDSYEAIEWSKVQIYPNIKTHKYVVRCKYRAKNSFGGYVVNNQIFYLDKTGKVVNVMDVK